MPNRSVTNRCCATTSSPMRTRGKRGPFHGAAVSCGEEDRPSPIWSAMMMKYLSGSSARPGPTYTCSMILLVPENQVVTRIALSRAADSRPWVA